MKSEMRNDAAKTLANATAKPDLDALRSELSNVLTQASHVRGRQAVAAEIRFCRWDGQSDDFRKHEADIGGKAAPFEGAPDTRIRLVDQLVRERVAVGVAALMQGEVQALPIGSDDVEAAAKTTRVLRWLRDNLLQSELRGEAELLANYVWGDDPGAAVLKVCWKREVGLELREMSMEEVGIEVLRSMGTPIGGDGQLPAGQEVALLQLADMLFDPNRQQDTEDAFSRAFPSVQSKRIRRALQELRRTGRTTLPLPYVKENRPSLAALRYMRDVFFPADVDDIQQARVVYEREWLSEPDLRSRKHTHGWDADWIDAVIEAGPGPCGTDGLGLVDAGLPLDAVARVEPETDSLFEVWHAHTKAADDYGIPGVYWTVFSGKVDWAHGYHDLLDYPHGGYPYVLFTAERVARGVDQSRGFSEKAGSYQSELKRERDSRGAHTMLTTVPPLRVTARRQGTEFVLGPMVQVPVREANDVTWMQPPPFPAASERYEEAVRRDADTYFGRSRAGEPSDMASALLQHDIESWLDRWRTVWHQVLALMQEYADPVEIVQVTGGAPLRVSREEMRGRYNLALAFSVRDLNLDFVVARMNAISTLANFDRQGSVDWQAILRWGFRGIDPTLADVALRDGQAVTQQEVNDELQSLVAMAQGIEPPLRQKGVNAELRLQTLNRAVMSSPTLSRRMQAPQNPDDELFRKLVENRAKNLTFLTQQFGVGPQSNPAIGRSGTAPLLG